MQRMKAALAVVIALTLLIGTYPLAPLSASTTSVTSPAAAASAPVAPAWPKIIDRDGNHTIVYQPQLKSWEKYRPLVADTAISITPAGGKQILGVISWRANTLANVSERTVYVSDIEVLSSRFPTLDPEHEAEMQPRLPHYDLQRLAQPHDREPRESQRAGQLRSGQHASSHDFCQHHPGDRPDG